MEPKKLLAILFSVSQGLSLSATLTFSVAELISKEWACLVPVAFFSFIADAYGTYSFQGQSIIDDKPSNPDEGKREVSASAYCNSIALQMTYLLLDILKHGSTLYFLAYELDTKIADDKPEVIFYSVIALSFFVRYLFNLSNAAYEACAMIHGKLTGVKEPKPFYHSLFNYVNLTCLIFWGTLEHTLAHCASLFLLALMLPSNETHMTSKTPRDIFNAYWIIPSVIISIVSIFLFAQTHFYEGKHTRHHCSNHHTDHQKKLPCEKYSVPFLKYGILILMPLLHAVDSFVAIFFSFMNCFESTPETPWMIFAGVVAFAAAYYTFRGILASEVKEAWEWLGKASEAHEENDDRYFARLDGGSGEESISISRLR